MIKLTKEQCFQISGGSQPVITNICGCYNKSQLVADELGSIPPSNFSRFVSTSTRCYNICCEDAAYPHEAWVFSSSPDRSNSKAGSCDSSNLDFDFIFS